MKSNIGRSVIHPEQNATKKLVSQHTIFLVTTIRNYRNSELRHSFHQIGSLALTQTSVNQLPGSSDINNRAVSVGSSVSNNCRKFWTFLKSSSLNPRIKNTKICCVVSVGHLNFDCHTYCGLSHRMQGCSLEEFAFCCLRRKFHLHVAVCCR